MVERSRAPAFATAAVYQEAYRNAHNFLAAYEGIATLKGMLETLIHAREEYDALQAAIQAGQREQQELDTALKRLRTQEQGLSGEVAKRQAEADAAHQTHLTQLREEQAALEGPLQAARQELREAHAQAEQVRATMHTLAQQREAQELAYHQQLVEELQQTQATLREENTRLSAQKARLMADLAEIVGKVELVRGA